MIRKLKGIIEQIEEDNLIIDVGGVGYHAFASANTLRKIPAKGQFVSLHIETHVREDHIHLFAFIEEEERKAFLALNKISGVGAKVALAILSHLSIQMLASTLAAEDKTAFKPVPGVGPKLAARIITELKDKFPVGFVSISKTTPDICNNNTASTFNTTITSNINDAVSALVNLGYSRTDAHMVVTKITAGNDNNIAVADLIKAGLKELSVK